MNILLDVLVNLKIAGYRFPLWIVIRHRALIFLPPMTACVHHARKTPDEERLAMPVYNSVIIEQSNSCPIGASAPASNHACSTMIFLSLANSHQSKKVKSKNKI